MADANIFQTYLRQPKSVQDYMAEADRGDLTRLQLEGQRGQNALLSLTRQQQAQASQMAMEERNALQRIAAQHAGNEGAFVDALSRSGLPGLMSQAEARRKAAADLGKTNADTEGKNIANAQAKRTAAIQQIASLSGPEEAVQLLQAKVQAGEVPAEIAPALLKLVQTDPKWQLKLIVGISNPEKMVELLRPIIQTRNTGATTDTLAVDPISGQPTVTGSVRNTMSPDAAASNAVARGNLALSRERLNFDKSAPRGQFLETPTGYVLGDPRAGTVAPVLGPDGKQVQGKAADRALTDSQAKANLFGSRMQEADKILSSLTGKYSPAAVQTKMGAEKLPGIGGAAGWAGNAMLSEESQQAEQAMRDFVNAVLRRESGAVISDSEFANAQKQYFPQPNDTDKNLKQKARNRQIAIEGLMAEVPSGKRGVPSLTNPGSPGPLKAGEVDAVAEALKKYGGN
jgi:hypothetical protein